MKAIDIETIRDTERYLNHWASKTKLRKHGNWRVWLRPCRFNRDVPTILVHGSTRSVSVNNAAGELLTWARQERITRNLPRIED